MAWTLVELSKIETDTLRKSVLDKFLWDASILELIPWETIGALATTIVRYADLPSVGFRKINEGYSAGTATFEQKVENISLMGGYLDCDKAIARAKNTIADARALAQNAALKAMAYHLNDKFINGDPQTDPEEFKGLEKRVDDLNSEGFTGQLIDGGHPSTDYMGILYETNARHIFLNNMDKLIYAVRGHRPDFLLMNAKMLLALRSILRQERLLDNTRDMFDRVVDVYQSARLIDIGVKRDQTTEILSVAETKSGSDNEVSIYAVKLGIGEYLWGIQEYPMEVDDKGLLEGSPVYRTEIDWPLGLALADPYSIARLYGIVPNSDAS